MEGFLRSAADGIPEDSIQHLLKALASEKIGNPALLSIALSDAAVCQNFVSKYKLPTGAEILLSVVVAQSSGLSNAFVQNALDDTKRMLREPSNRLD